MLRPIFYFFFKLFGWKVVGSVYNELDKKLFVVMPHTSNWDFCVGLGVKVGYGMELNYLAKDTLFRIPLVGWFVRVMGGVPVDRSRNNRLVDICIDYFTSRNRFGLVITPEGTRSKVTKLRRGFYRIAEAAQIPLVFVSFNYKTKTVTFREPFYVSGDYDADMRLIKPFYDGIVAAITSKNGLPEIFAAYEHA